MGPDANELDGSERARVYEDGTVVRIHIRRTSDSACLSGWRYTLHYGAFTPRPDTLENGTIRRYDDSHEDTKGHERHGAAGPEPNRIEFPGMEKLYERFWDKIPHERFGPSTTGDTND